MALTKVTGGVVSPSSDYAINNVTGVAATFTGNVSIGGTLTYQDVSNIDAVGIITAQKGIQITGDGLNVTSGIATFAGAIDANSTLNVSGNAEFGAVVDVAGDLAIADTIRHIGDGDTKIRFPSNDTVSVETAGSERLRIASDGKVGIGTDSIGAKLTVSADSSNTSLTGHNYLASQSGIILQNRISSSGHFTAYTGNVSSSGGYTQSGSLAFEATGSGTTPKIHITQRTGSGVQSKRLTINTSGDIEVSTTTDTSAHYLKFNANRSNDGDHLGGIYGVWNGNSVGAINILAGPVGASKTDGHLQFITYAAGTAYERLRITSAGKVGIGSAIPTSQLDIKRANVSGTYPNGNAKPSGASIWNDGGDTFTGRLFFQGTALSASSDFLTGMNNEGNVLVVYNYGSSKYMQKWHKNAQVELYHDNNLRLNTTTQGTKIGGHADTVLLVEGTSTASRIDLKTSSHHRFWQTLESDGRFRFYDQTNAAERFTISSVGKVGIGITNPTGNLHLDGGSNDPYIYIQRSGAGDGAVTLGGIFFKNSANNLALIDVKSDDINDGHIKFSTMGAGTLAERLKITSTGQFHMGGGSSWTYANQKFVVVEGSNPLGMLLQGNNANQGVNLTLQNINNNVNAYSDLSFADDGGQIFGAVRGKVVDRDNNHGEIQFHTSAGTLTQRLTIDINGKVGINTATPGAQLEVKGSGSSNTLSFLTKDVNRNNVFWIKDGGRVGLHYSPLVINQDTGDTDTPSGTYFYVHHASNPFIITNAGKVGVGKTDPDGVGVDVLSSRTNAYSGTSDHRGLAHIIARNASDAAGRFASISLVSGGGTQAEGSINLVQTGSYTGDLAFKLRTGATSWLEKFRVCAANSGIVVYGNDNVFYGGHAGQDLNGSIKIRSVGNAVYQNLFFTSSDGTNTGSIVGYYGGSVMFFNSTSYVWSINSQGERLELTNTALSPRATSTVLDLGTTTKRYRRTHTDAITVNTTNTNTKFCINGGSSANVMTIRNTTGGNGNVGILFSTQDSSTGREKAAIYHQETHGEAHYGGDFIFCLNSATGGAAQVSTSDERMRITRHGELKTKNRGDQRFGLTIADEYGVWGSNTGLAPNTTRTWTITNSSYGWGRFCIGGGDGNYQRAACIIDYGGVMWSTAKSYYHNEIVKSSSGASISTTYNNGSIVVSVTAGSNWWYYTVNLIQGRRDSSSWATITQS